MKKLSILCLIVLLTVPTLFSQTERAGTTPGPGQPVAQNIGVDTAQQKLKEISLSKFEDAGFWRVAFSGDQGIVSARRLEGAPAAKKPIPDEQQIGIKEEDKYVLGVKTEFFRRGAATITIKPSRPLGIAGVVKTLSVWVAGRNYNHTLKVLLEDFSGKPFELTVGKLNFSGWKQLVVAIPPTVEQRNPHYSTQTGIKFLGFAVECDMRETYGNYYIYFDDLRAVTDLFAEENRDADDMLDAW
ncbi:MAG: flagellar filament outer layer protein FlaA [Spirochaetes bacterium]|nr:flagellar filament outer layer protein FlaA [Spirochaetota bacterium]